MVKLDPATQVSLGGQPRIELRFLGKICGMDLFIDVAGQVNQEEAFQLAVVYMYNAFIAPKENNNNE